MKNKDINPTDNMHDDVKMTSMITGVQIQDFLNMRRIVQNYMMRFIST